MFDVLMLGSSGQSRETIQLLRLLGLCNSTSEVTTADESNEATLLAQVEAGASVRCIALGIGRPDVRLRVWNTWRRVVTDPWPTLVHPGAILGDTTSLGEGAMINAGVVTTSDVSIGPACLLNTNVSIGHDVTVEEAAVVNPGSTIGGGAVIGAAALIGSGANVQEGIRVGPGAVVGSGAVVTRDVAPGDTVVGVPARAVRE